MFLFDLGEYAMYVPRVLPLSVRFASEHKGGQLGREEISDLLNGGFADEAIPLVLEALASDSDTQKKFLDAFVRCVWKFNSDVAIRATLHETLGALPPDFRVPARELIEMSWCGFVSRKKMELCATMNWVEARVPVLVGYSSAIALVSFIRCGAEFYLMLPQHIDGNADCGYEFYPTPDGYKVFLAGRDIGETKISLISFPDRFGRQEAEVLKADFERACPRDIVLESVLG